MARKWVSENINKDSRFNSQVVDVAGLNLPFYNEPAGGPFAIAGSGGEYTNTNGKAWAKKVADADAFILVTAEYNHGYPAALKNALDWVGPEWGGKPVSFVSYGYSGGIRATEQLRQVVAELGLNQTRNAVALNFMSDFDEQNNPNNEHSLSSLKQVLNQIQSLKK